MKELLMTERQKDALLCAAAGRHNVLFYCAPYNRERFLRFLQELQEALPEEENSVEFSSSGLLLDPERVLLVLPEGEDEEKKAYEVEDLKALVLKAVDRQKVYDPEEEEWERLWNSEANPNGFLRWDTAETRLEELSESWSARKKASCAQVARTLADLDGEDYVTSAYMDRAASFFC